MYFDGVFAMLMKCAVSFAGSSNSQDSFPSGPGGGMDGYGGYGYGNEYGNQRGPPAMQSNQGLWIFAPDGARGLSGWFNGFCCVFQVCLLNREDIKISLDIISIRRISTGSSIWVAVRIRRLDRCILFIRRMLKGTKSYSFFFMFFL